MTGPDGTVTLPTTGRHPDHQRHVTDGEDAMRGRAGTFGSIALVGWGARSECREESAMSTKVIREHKAAATTAGILYITGTVAGVLSLVLSAPVRDASDPFAAAAEHSGVVVTGALLVLVMGLSLAFVPVVLFPVLRRVDEVLAIGYLVMRGAVETACYVLLSIGWLLLVPLGEAMSAGSETASPAGVRLGSLVVDADAVNAVLALVFCLGATMFYVLLYRSRIVPRWIAVWGLVAIPVYVVADLLAMYSVIGANSSQQVLMFMPLAVQEMVLAVWMIARGFRPPAVPTTSELRDGTLVGG
jgi:hypothetical protein